MKGGWVESVVRRVASSMTRGGCSRESDHPDPQLYLKSPHASCRLHSVKTFIRCTAIHLEQGTIAPSPAWRQSSHGRGLPEKQARNTRSLCLRVASHIGMGPLLILPSPLPSLDVSPSRSSERSQQPGSWLIVYFSRPERYASPDKKCHSA